MGLLDTMDDPQFRLGMGLLAAGSARSDGAGIGQRLNEVLGGMDQWKQQQAAQKRAALQEQMFNLQLEEAKKKSADEAWQQDLARKFYKTDAPLLSLPESGADVAANPMGRDPSQAMITRPPATPKFDFQGYATALAERNPVQALSVMQALQKDDTPIAVSEGGSLFKRDGTLIARGTVKPPTPTADIQNYQYAVLHDGYKGTFEQWDTARKNAASPKVAVNTSDPTALAKAGMDLQTQVRTAFKDDHVIANQFQAMNEAVKNPSAQGDTALLYSFFKVLDPASTVREGELDLVLSSRSIPDRFKGYAQKLASGQTLMPNERQDLLNQAARQVQTRIPRAENERKAYIENAKRLTLDPDVYVPNPYAGISLMNPAGNTQQTNIDSLVKKYTR